ncbi:MAG: hypothetical protein GEU97_10135 [Actinophytocola sp.]|nr:hypothetical protein [Actinophytocola sp.]
MRTRLVLTVMGVVTVAAVALSALAYALVSRSLRAEVLDRAVEEARFSVGVLAAERLDATVAPRDIAGSGLADDFERRGTDVYVDFARGEDFVSGLGVPTAPEVVSGDVRDLLAAGHVAAEWVDVGGSPYLVTATRKPPSGPDFYFVTETSGVDSALEQLRLVLLGASVVLVLVGAFAGGRMARLAGSLADSVDELTAARDRERRFVADVSHELRTPVTALVQEAAELAGERDALPTGTRRVVELLDRDVRRLRGLVEELLELSRLDAAGDAADLDVVDVDVARLLDAVVAQRLPAATVRAPTGLRVRTDRRRLERIVANLVDNAHVHADGRSVTVDADLDGPVLVIEVADEGPGVPDDDLERIFDRFTMGDTARAGTGSGLGLAILREHARVLRAQVTARNRDSGGLAVEVRVPVMTDL